MSENTCRIGTRQSRLARWQTDRVAALLKKQGLHSEQVFFSTKGDRELDKPLPELGDKALFTAELDEALLNGEVDMAVHSLKDLPTTMVDGLVLASVPERAEEWDVLVARDQSLTHLEELPEAPTLATSSLRRAAQLLKWRPKARIVPVRGNVETRIAKLDASDWDGAILAEAGLRRLGLENRISVRMPVDVMLPGISQGALAIVCAKDSRAISWAQSIDDQLQHARVRCERAFLRRLEGGCQVPIGAVSLTSDSIMTLKGMVSSLDGSDFVDGEISGGLEEAEQLGIRLAEELIERGASRILRAVRETAQ